MTRDQAYEILTKYMKGENYITHSLAVEAIMKVLVEKECLGAYPSTIL